MNPLNSKFILNRRPYARLGAPTNKKEKRKIGDGRYAPKGILKKILNKKRYFKDI
jgi:hypothetical protein